MLGDSIEQPALVAEQAIDGGGLDRGGGGDGAGGEGIGAALLQKRRSCRDDAHANVVTRAAALEANVVAQIIHFGTLPAPCFHR